MARIIEIKDLSLPELAAYTRLKDPPYRAGWEAENGIFIAENPKVIDIAMRAGYTPLSLLSERRHIEGTARGVIEAAGDIPVYTADRKVLASLTGYELTRGVLCAMRRKAPPPVTIKSRPRGCEITSSISARSSAAPQLSARTRCSSPPAAATLSRADACV